MKHNYKGYTINIEQDIDAQSPREWDNIGTMACWHSRYNLGDKHNFDNPDEFKEQITTNDNFILPLYLYDHSGITISTKPFGNNWDSGQVGFIYCSKEKAQQEFPNYKDFKKLKGHIYAILEQEVKTYDQFLTGDVYGFSVENTDLAVWGFYGEDEALQEAKNEIDWLIKQEVQKKVQKTKLYIKNHVPIIYRKEA